MQRSLGYCLIIFAAALWAFLGPLALYCLQYGISPLEIAFWRTALAGVFLCLHAKASRTLQLQSVQDGVAFFLFGAVAIGGFFSIYQFCVRDGGAALASILLYTAPVWVAALSWFFYQEPITKAKAAGILVSLAGVGLISLPGGTVSFGYISIAFGLLCGFLYSTHYIFVRHYLEKYSPFTIYGLSMLSAGFVLFFLTDFAEERSLGVWGCLLGISIFSTYGAYWIYSEGLKRVALTEASVLATFEPVLATVIAWLWWGESFAFWGWVGAGLVLLAVLLVIFGGEKEKYRDA